MSAPETRRSGGDMSAALTSRADWTHMGIYQRFEDVTARILGGIISVVVVVSLLQLIRGLFNLLVFDAMNPLDHSVFQQVFGMIMTLLIAMEFRHSILQVSLRGDHIIQVKTVVLIAILAMARKFVILDLSLQSDKIAALSGALLVLGIVYWLMRERDDPRA